MDLSNNAVEDLINQYDIMGVIGNGANFDTLMEAGIKNVPTSDSGGYRLDELNLLTCLIAKKTGNCQTIARVRNPEYSKELNLF